jgi:carbon storage regulator
MLSSPLGTLMYFRQKEVAMLVVTRRPGESVVFELPTDERIEITILAVKGSHVRLGIDAPHHLPVVRKEMLDRLSDEAPATAGRVRTM